LTALDDGFEADVIDLDYSKTFDREPHARLMKEIAVGA